MYRTFIRTWWKANPNWPNGLEPKAGRRHYVGNYQTEVEARAACHKWNSENKPGKYSRKMEFEEV